MKRQKQEIEKSSLPFDGAAGASLRGVNFQNKKILILLFFGVIAGSYLLGDYFLGDGQKTTDSGQTKPTPETSGYFHSLAENLKIPKAVSIAPPASFAELSKKLSPAVVNIATAKDIPLRRLTPWGGDPFPNATHKKRIQNCLLDEY